MSSAVKFPIGPDSPESIQLDELVSMLNTLVKDASAQTLLTPKDGLMDILAVSALPSDLKMRIRLYYLKVSQRPGFQISDWVIDEDQKKELETMLAKEDPELGYMEGLERLVDYSRGFIEARLRAGFSDPKIGLKVDAKALAASSPFKHWRAQEYFNKLLEADDLQTLDHSKVREELNAHWLSCEDKIEPLRKGAEAYWAAKRVAQEKTDTPEVIIQKEIPAAQAPEPSTLLSEKVSALETAEEKAKRLLGSGDELVIMDQEVLAAAMEELRRKKADGSAEKSSPIETGSSEGLFAAATATVRAKGGRIWEAISGAMKRKPESGIDAGNESGVPEAGQSEPAPMTQATPSAEEDVKMDALGEEAWFESSPEDEAVDGEALKGITKEELEKGLESFGKASEKGFQAVEPLVERGSFGIFTIVAKNVVEKNPEDGENITSEMVNLRWPDGSLFSEKWFREQEVNAWVISPEHKTMETLLRVMLENYRYNFITPEGKYLRKKGFRLADNVCQGMARAMNDDGSWSYFKFSEGRAEWISDPFNTLPIEEEPTVRFERATNFVNGVAEADGKGQQFLVGLDGTVALKRQNPFAKPANAPKASAEAPALSTLVYGEPSWSPTENPKSALYSPVEAVKPKSQVPTPPPKPKATQAPAQPVAETQREHDFMVSPDETADFHAKMRAKVLQPLVLPPIANPELREKMKGILSTFIFEQAVLGGPEEFSPQFLQAWKDYVNLSKQNSQVDLGHRVIAKALKQLRPRKKIEARMIQFAHGLDMACNPESIEALTFGAVNLYEMGNFADAKKCLQEALALNPAPKFVQWINDTLKIIDSTPPPKE